MSGALDQDLNDQLWSPPGTKIIDGQPVQFRNVVVKTIVMSDVEDPDLFVAEPMYQWQQSDEGQWIMNNSQETPYWTRMVDPTLMGWRYRIVARLSEPNEMFWRLKWGNK